MRTLPKGLRRILLAAALAGTVAVTVAVSGQESDETAVVAPSARKAQQSEESRAAKRAPPAGGSALLALEPRRFDSEPADVFKVVRPPPPPVAAKPAQAEERPAAPPLPFKYLGRMDEGETSVLLLSFQGQDIMARAGDTVGERYRVEEVAEAWIRFTYLPLNEQQTLKIGERN